MISDPREGEVASLGYGKDILLSLRRIHAVVQYETFFEICIVSHRAAGPAYSLYTPEAFSRVIWTFTGPVRITWRSHAPEKP